jgi:hypothetical protein
MSRIRNCLILAIFGAGLAGCIVYDDAGRGRYHHSYYGGWHDDYYSRPYHPYSSYWR